jgi:type II secretory pathway pseudopilin PulG
MSDQPPAVPKPSSGLSTTSLVLGILSLVMCSIFTGIPAVITGHIALSRAKGSTPPSPNRGQAIAGLVMGYISIAFLVFVVPMLAVLAAIALPALAKAKSRAQDAACVANIKQICLAARMYANDHNDKWPEDFLSMSNELNTPMVLVCPSDSSRSKVSGWSGFDESNISYKLLTPKLDESKTGKPVPAVTCTKHKYIIGFSDGHVERGSKKDAGFGF